MWVVFHGIAACRRQMRQVQRHQHNWPVNRMETQNILPNQMQICRPELIKLLCGIAITIIANTGAYQYASGIHSAGIKKEWDDEQFPSSGTSGSVCVQNFFYLGKYLLYLLLMILICGLLFLFNSIIYIFQYYNSWKKIDERSFKRYTKNSLWLYLTRNFIHIFHSATHNLRPDIGAPAKVLSTGKGYAELLFKFSDGEEITSKCPLSIIDAIAPSPLVFAYTVYPHFSSYTAFTLILAIFAPPFLCIFHLYNTIIEAA